MKRFISVFLAIMFIIGQSTFVFADKNTSNNINIGSKSAVLMDVSSGQVLYEKNCHEKLPPASVTKVMTMLLICEALESGKIKINDEVTISENAASMGGSQIFLEPGEVQTVDTLLKGIAVASANDACVAMAEYIGGSVEEFVDMMNKKAKELKMNDTNFVNTNGLPVENHYTSAYDIGIMSRELLKHELIEKYLTTWMDNVVVGKKKATIGLANTNKLIKHYNGATGVKTGFTGEAKFCVSASAKRGKTHLIAVILG
ncbi:MAG: D-alanyl-D-alanine carboxypeptidase family protein, partial [Intestinibacter sp.]|uniref:D-alanyl-D-alanine carboxypeptidase family protein n=1 Tax=Intestinibacter sp. TaxID=1965304 RepID=UPI003F136489